MVFCGYEDLPGRRVRGQDWGPQEHGQGLEPEGQAAGPAHARRPPLLRGCGLLLLAHEDRPYRFGFDWFAYFADSHGCAIRVVNQSSQSPQAEWVEDLMAVVDTFSGRLPGLRRYRKQIREAAVDG